MSPAMRKRPAADSPARGRKRGKAAKTQEEAEDDDLVLAQLRRKAILEAKDEDEEWLEIQEEGGEWLEDIYIPPKITRVEHPCTGERLVIDKIVCENFKSYAGIKAMGPFHKSFSAIIGPNGNGKSNIIDALLFVFGYRASKIRCKKVSTLIHKSELLHNLRSCAVTVHFVKIIDEGESSDYRVVENSEIKVMRRASTDNSSKYYLNGASVKFQEIAKFLKQNGIDIVHNRFLILQGEVEQIASMPPISSPTGNDTGLLEFLEEVIGTKRYVKPLAQLDERLEKLDYDRDEKLQRMDLAEKDKAALAEPVKKAVEYLKDQNEKTRHQNALYQKQRSDISGKMEDLEEIKKDHEEKLASIEQSLQEISEKNSKRKKELQEAEKEFKTAEKEYGKVKRKFEEADSEYIQVSQELQRTNENRKKLQKDVAKVEREIEKLKSIPGTHEKDIDELSKRKAELDKDIAKEEESIKGDLEKLNKKIDVALKEKEDVDREFANLKSQRDEKKSTLEKLQKEFKNMQEKEVKEKSKLEELKSQLEQLKDAIKQKEREGRNSLGGSKVQSMENKLQQLTSEAKSLQEVESQKRSALDEITLEFQQAQEAIDGNSQLGQVDRALLEAKSDGQFPGLYGRMKDLAKIPEKYNVAATMSTGMLDHWVTDTDETAGNCLEFLRQNSLPVQNFVCISRIQHYVGETRAPFHAPPRSHRIFDLLNISKPELAPAYFKAFKNTLVADTLNIANEVSRHGGKRYRVATLQGEMVEPTGSMTGGGRSKPVGKFNKNSAVSISKQQLNKIKQKMDDASKEHTVALNERKSAEEKARVLNEQIQELKRKINNYNSDLSALKAQLPLKQANIETQERRVKEVVISEAVLKNKEKAISKAEKDYENLAEPFSRVEENLEKTSEKLHELQVTTKNKITKQLDKFTEQRKKVIEELNKKTVELKNCETNLKKSETKLNSLHKEIEKLQKLLDKKLERRHELEVSAKELKAKEETLLSQLEEKRQNFDTIKGTANEFQKEENALSKEKAALENKFSDVQAEYKACKNHIKSINQQLESLELNELPEETVVPLAQLTEEQLAEVSIQETEKKIKKLTEKLKNTKTPNLNVLDEYREKVNILYVRIKELEEATILRDKFREAFCKLDQQRSTEFMEGFALISSRLKEMFRMISMGGDAELEVVDILDLFGCGIQFSVRPAKKTWKKISNLSGGEKTLASLSLVFALHHFKPSPFYVMDEIDAALDFKNVSIIANYIKDRTKFTQFIIISLRSNMFELADSLLGVYKVDNMSYCIHFGIKHLLTTIRQKTEALKNQQASQTPNKKGNPSAANKTRPGFPDADISAILSEADVNEPNPNLSQSENEATVVENATVVTSPKASSSSKPSTDSGVGVNNNGSGSGSTATTTATASSSETAPSNNAHPTDNIPESQESCEDVSTPSDNDAQGPGPLAFSTPFVGKRPSWARGAAETGRSDESSGDKEPDISPIKSTTTVGKSHDTSCDDDETFDSAEDDSEEILGPSP